MVMRRGCEREDTLVMMMLQGLKENLASETQASPSHSSHSLAAGKTCRTGDGGLAMHEIVLKCIKKIKYRFKLVLDTCLKHSAINIKNLSKSSGRTIKLIRI